MKVVVVVVVVVLVVVVVIIITSPAGAVVKYCDEIVSLFVCEDISGTTCTIFTKFFVHVAYVCGSQSSGTLTIGRIARRREGVVQGMELTELLQRAPPIFSRAAMTLGIGPHSGLLLIVLFQCIANLVIGECT